MYRPIAGITDEPRFYRERLLQFKLMSVRDRLQIIEDVLRPTVEAPEGPGFSGNDRQRSKCGPSP